MLVDSEDDKIFQDAFGSCVEVLFRDQTGIALEVVCLHF